MLASGALALYVRSMNLNVSTGVGFATLFGIALDQGKIKSVEQPVRDFFPGKDFCDFEAALVKLGKDYCRKLRCGTCPLGTGCACAKAPTTKEDIPHH